MNSERWPHPSIVANELKEIRKEKRLAEWREKRAHYDEIRGRMRGDDYDYDRITRRISVAILTQRMMKIGERIALDIATREETRRPLGD